MLLTLLRPFRLLAGAVRETCGPRQIAGGAALGMVIGLVPKDNLTAWSLMVLLMLFRVNLAAGLLSAFVFSWLGSLLDPASHAIGLSLLGSPELRPYLVRIFNTPLMPWTGLNNTVVLGSLFMGLFLLAPTYQASLLLAQRYVPRLQAVLQRFRVYHVLYGADLAATWRTS